MKNARVLFMLLCAGTSVLHAQYTPAFQRREISIGPEYAIPVAAFRKGAGVFDAPGTRFHYGIGGSAKYLYRIKPAYGVSLQAGAIRYHSSGPVQAVSGGTFSFTAIPVKLGADIRYKNLFAEPQLGFTWFSDNHTMYQSRSATYGIGVGTYVIPHVTLSGNYERWNRGGFAASHWGLRLAYTLYPSTPAMADSGKPKTIATPHIPWRYDTESTYWKKHRTFKTLGWVSVGVGVPLTLAGLVTAIAAIENSRIRTGTYEWMIASGAAVTVSAVPFFLLSHHYKKKARVAP